MTETDNTIILAGRVIGFIPPTEGQIQAMIRIGKTLQKGADDAPQDFWLTQINRIGTLLESLIVEGDRELVDELYLTGKIDHTALLSAIMGKLNSKQDSEGKAPAKGKPVRVQRK